MDEDIFFNFQTKKLLGQFLKKNSLKISQTYTDLSLITPSLRRGLKFDLIETSPSSSFHVQIASSVTLSQMIDIPKPDHAINKSETFGNSSESFIYIYFFHRSYKTHFTQIS